MGGDLYFDYPSLSLSYGQRFIRRIGRNILMIVLWISAVVLLLSDVPALVTAGGVITLYLFYRLVRKVLTATPRIKFSGGNLVHFMSGRSRKIILTARDRSAFLGGSFLLHLTRELLESPAVIRVLRALDVDREEFLSKLETYIQDEKRLRETDVWRKARIEEVARLAFITQPDDKRAIEPVHLFLVLPKTDNERLKRLFNLFGLDSVKMEKASRFHDLVSR